MQMKQKTKEFQEKLDKRFGSDLYTVESDYFDNETLITIRHLKCGFESTSTPHIILQSEGYCKYCSSSEPEKAVWRYLSDNNIAFTTEKTFDGLVNENTGRLFRFDFFIPGDVPLIIEIHGEQHYIPTKFSKTDSDHDAVVNLKRQQKYDGIKEKYAEDAGYDFLIISYKQFDFIKRILNKQFHISTERGRLSNTNIIDKWLDDLESFDISTAVKLTIMKKLLAYDKEKYRDSVLKQLEDIAELDETSSASVNAADLLMKLRNEGMKVSQELLY